MAKTYSDELKAQVIADFAMGATKAGLSKKYSVPRTTVIDWITTTAPPVPTVTDTDQRARLGELVYEYLVTGFEALIAQHRQGADAAYLKSPIVPLAEIYKSFHAGVIAVAQAVDRGQSADDQAGIPGSAGAGG